LLQSVTGTTQVGLNVPVKSEVHIRVHNLR